MTMIATVSGASSVMAAGARDVLILELVLLEQWNGSDVPFKGPPVVRSSGHSGHVSLTGHSDKFIVQKAQVTRAQSGTSFSDERLTCIEPARPVDSIRLATFTVLPHMSKWGFLTPMTPAVIGP